MFVAGLPSNLKEQYKEMHTEDFLYLACYLHHSAWLTAWLTTLFGGVQH